MKRFEEKVKDIVEVRASPGLSDFLADPAATLKGFHFTDITADLMSKWIGQIADVKKGRGAAFALAGYRGVGKSHFLAALSAIVSQPELRNNIADTHVTSTAQRLSRRHGVVAHLKRGAADSLLTELKMAVAEVLGSGTGGLSDSLNELLFAAAEKAGDTPLVLLIDTAFGRETRVARDDGALLSDIAESAIIQGIFVGIALDDDIAGADGLNSSIASHFSIDYLDQEHLYKIVDAHIFPKHEQLRPILHEIYGDYRKALPGFRWSEHRFSCLYPMHPAILEIAPFVRLYLQDFALLGFAVEAGLRILGRPANSLISLDEVFDKIEKRLRGIKDLKEAFTAYDSLDRNVIAKSPVMQRHEAKLVLKGLFLLSFSGEGVTAAEVAAAMLIFDEADPAAGTKHVEAILQAFSEAFPDAVKRSESPDKEAKFALKVGGGDNLNSALAEAMKNVSPDTAELALRRQTADKFAEFDISDDGSTIWATCHLAWRGGIRPGEVIWQAEGIQADDGANESADWKVLIAYSSAAGSEAKTCEWPICEWRLGELSAGDKDTILRFHALQTNNELREKFRESIPAALQVHSMAVEKIWQRIFFEDGRLLAGANEYQFTEAARSSHSLTQLFSVALEDELRKQYSSHPEFPQMLGAKEVSSISEQLFTGARTNDPEVQKLAANFALPLGLVSENDDGLYAPLSANELAELQIIKEAFAGSDEGGITSIDELSTRMRRSPYGLTREARHLVLTALVAQRQYEFVTSSGNRINHRSLDLQIDWDDIVGLAKPSADAYSDDRLIFWASLLSGDIALRTLKASEARSKVTEAFSGWLGDWQKADLVRQFDVLPDEKLNSKLWRSAANVKKTFGLVSESIDSLLRDDIALDKCLQTIADIFADSEDEFESKQQDLTALREFMDRSVERDKVNKYLAGCAPTDDSEVDDLRCSLMESVASGYFNGHRIDDVEFNERWENFRDSYSEQYAEKHDAVMKAGRGRQKLDEFLRTDAWSTFSGLSEIPWFGRYDMERSMAIIRKLRSSECDFDVQRILAAQPFCDCSFRLADVGENGILIDELQYIVAQGMDYFRRKLLAQKDQFSVAVNAIGNAKDNETPSKVADLVTFLETDGELPILTARELSLIRIATRHLDTSDPLHSDRRRSTLETFVGFDPAELRELENDMDSLAGLSILNG